MLRGLAGDRPRGLTRYDASLHEGWYCCRFIVMRMVVDKFGTGARGRQLPFPSRRLPVADGALVGGQSEGQMVAVCCLVLDAAGAGRAELAI